MRSDELQEESMERLSDKHFGIIKQYLHDAAGIHLPDGKINMVHNRIAKRKKQLSLLTFDDYIDYLKKNGSKGEIINLVNALTTNVTHFFREGHHFEHLGQQIKALADQGQKKVVIWSAGCSIGAEPYSMSITAEEARKAGANCEVRILATDIDTIALARARKGEYNEGASKGLTRHHIGKYFTEQEGPGGALTVKAKDSIRKKIAFNYLNLNDNPWPMKGPFDFIFCRNVLIYFSSDKQREFVDKMTRLLRPGGFLYLGHSEYFISDSKDYKALGQTIFQKYGDTE